NVLIYIISSFLIFIFNCYGNHRDLHSFPTRRSSDLVLRPRVDLRAQARRRALRHLPARRPGRPASGPIATARQSPPRAPAMGPRSEEHTSELQSRSDLVCRLLLEKKKKINRKKMISM